MKNFILPLVTVCILLTSCKKEEPEPDNNNTTPSVPQAQGCFVQNVLADNLNPFYTFHYVEEYPNVLDMYKSYDEISGDVMHTYQLRYNNFSDNRELDSLIHYYGDIIGSANFDDVTVFYYTFFDGEAQMDSAEVFVYNFFTGETLIKGTLHYDYNELGLLETYSYIDYPDNSITSLVDEYFIDYVYDTNGQMLELHYFNYLDVETYYEIHVLTDFMQPNYLLTTNPVLAQSNLYAPSQTIGHYGANTYTYNYIYQVNDKNYVVEQDLVANGDTTFLKLFNYECYE